MSDSPKNPEGQRSSTNPLAGTIEMWIRIPKRKQGMTIAIIALSVLVYLIQLFTQSRYEIDLPLNLFALDTLLIYRGQFWRFITYAFIHGSILHIALNMLALFFLGRLIERFFGPWRLAILYMMGILGGGLFHFYFSDKVAVGAATGIFALFSAQLVLIWRNRFLWGPDNRRAIFNLLGILGVNLVLNFLPGMGGLSLIGGILAGLAFAWFCGPIFNLVPAEGEQNVFDVVDLVEHRQTLLVTVLALIIMGGLIALRVASAL